MIISHFPHTPWQVKAHNVAHDSNHSEGKSQMTNPSLSAPSYSRFHAIISATPATGLPPRSATATTSSYQHPASLDDHVDIYQHIYNENSQNGKRRRTMTEPGPSNLERALEDAARNESTASRQRPTKFQSKEHMLEALRLAFRNAPDVDFHGSYEIIGIDMHHKQRVQALTMDIWRATGYRFTVKDHPPINNGHKTRFWCSQDEAHRSKSSRLARMPNSTSKPRISSAGEALAKARYPCKSRLLISSRDSNSTEYHIVTVRMHHHVAHEPYVDTSLPPEVAQVVYESFGWNANSNGDGSPTQRYMVHHHQQMNSNSVVGTGGIEMHYPDSEGEGDDEDGDAEGDEDEEDEEMHSLTQTPITTSNGAGTGTSATPWMLQGNVNVNVNYNINDGNGNGSNNIGTTSVPLHHQPPPHQQQQHQQQQIDPQRYHQRMRAHINNIRDFCDGLEYQLQFNDYRMLNVLEGEGASFLRLVQDCLKKEGRLDPAGSIG